MKTLSKTLAASVLLIFSSASLIFSTDAPITSDEKAAIVADWERAKAFSLEYLEAMPADAYSYKPNDDVRSFEQQFLHIAQGNIGLVANATDAERIYTEVQVFDNEESFKGKENVVRITTEVYD